MTPEDVIAAIHRMWPKSVYATNIDWHVQYEKQLRVFAGPDLMAGWQRVMENLQKLTKGTPPKPDVIAAMCRELKRESQPVQRKNDYEPPRSQQYPMTEKEIADTNRQISEVTARIKRANKDTMDDSIIFRVRMDEGVLRVLLHTLDRHQRVIEGR